MNDQICAAHGCGKPAHVQVNADYLCAECCKHEVPEGYCASHKMWEAEGGPCPECERLGQLELDHVVRLHFATNDYFLRWYNTPDYRKFKVRPDQVREYIAYCWVLSYDQCLLDLMKAGYAMCNVAPMIRRIHGELDASYAAYQKEWEGKTQAPFNL